MNGIVEFRGVVPGSKDSGRRSEDFLRFLRESVSVENLLPDRQAQAVLARIMEFHSSRSEETIRQFSSDGHPMMSNPYPVLELKGNGANYIHSAFMLRDGKYYYYFPIWDPMQAVPPYLRPGDVVRSKTYSQTYPEVVRTRIMEDLRISIDEFARLVYFQDPRVTRYAVLVDIPFNKPFCRVAVGGGESQRFNYNTNEWELSGDGVYSPGIVGKIRSLLPGGSRVGRTIAQESRRKALPPGQK